MYVVCHAAEGMNTATKLNGHFLHEKAKTATIRIINEYRLTCVAAKNDVIECSGKMYACFTSNEWSIAGNI